MHAIFLQKKSSLHENKLNIEYTNIEYQFTFVHKYEINLIFYYYLNTFDERFFEK